MHYNLPVIAEKPHLVRFLPAENGQMRSIAIEENAAAAHLRSPAGLSSQKASYLLTGMVELIIVNY